MNTNNSGQRNVGKIMDMDMNKSMGLPESRRGIARNIMISLLIGLGLALSAMPAQAGTIMVYVHTDHLGNPVAETDSTGAVIRRQSYAPYGETAQGADPNGPGFTGHRNDSDTGLVYMEARYYDPVIGRFLSADPVTFSPDKPQQFNRYWYANGNPYLYMDRDGRYPESAEEWGNFTDPNAKAGLDGLGQAIADAASEVGQIVFNEDGNVVDIDDPKPPLTGEPNSTVRGKKQTRKYGPDGNPETDVEYGHEGEGGDPDEVHSHDWDRPVEEDGLGTRGPQREHDPDRDPPPPRGFD